MASEYSDKEIAMFEQIGVESAVMKMFSANQIYNVAVRKAFTENQQGR